MIRLIVYFKEKPGKPPQRLYILGLPVEDKTRVVNPTPHQSTNAKNSFDKHQASQTSQSS